MLDAAVATVLPSHQQAVGLADDFAPTPSGCRPAWCVAATYPQAERRAHAALHRKGYEPYLPLVTIRRPDRSWRTVPLFPGYVFLHLDLARPWYPIRFAPGVFHLLTTDGHPAMCSDTDVEAVRSALHAAEALAALSDRADAAPAPGTPVDVANGMSGVVLSTSRSRAIVAVVLLGGLRRVSVPLDQLSPRAA